MRKFSHILTKEVLETEYAKHGNLITVAKNFGVATDTIKNYMMSYNLCFTRKVLQTCNDTYFSQPNKDSLYWSGFLAADGNVYGNDVTLRLSLKDLDHVRKFKSSLDSTSNIRFESKKSRFKNYPDVTYESAIIKIRSKRIVSDLSQYNVVPNKTPIFEIPKWILSHTLVNHFLRGFIDGDGSYRLKNGNININVCGTLKAVEEINNLLSTKCKVVGGKISPINKDSLVYRLDYYRNNESKEILKFLYTDADLYLERKYKLVKHLLEY